MSTVTKRNVNAILLKRNAKERNSSVVHDLKNFEPKYTASKAIIADSLSLPKS